MPVSYAQLKALLDVDEPDYPALAEMAAGAMQHLRKLAASPDLSLASKAVSLAGIMGDTDSIGIVRSASKSRHALVRVAAAHAASLLPDSPQAARVVSTLLDDNDIGVVKIATRAASAPIRSCCHGEGEAGTCECTLPARAATEENSQRERSRSHGKESGKKAGGGAKRAKATRKGSAKAGAGQMPIGAMTEPPKGAKARARCRAAR